MKTITDLAYLEPAQFGHRIYTPVPNPVIAETIAALRSVVGRNPHVMGPLAVLLTYEPKEPTDALPTR